MVALTHYELHVGRQIVRTDGDGSQVRAHTGVLGLLNPRPVPRELGYPATWEDKNHRS